MLNNLIQVTQYFADRQNCIDYLIKTRWNGNVTCAHCGHDKVYELKGANKRFKCAGCRKQFSATKGTIFENSPVALQKWFVAIYLISTHKKGISSHQLARDLAVTQKTAWFMLHRIRMCYNTDDSGLMGGEGVIVECDDTVVGGKVSNMHVSKRRKLAEAQLTYSKAMHTNKTNVMGYIERGNKLRMIVMDKDAKAHEYIAGGVALDSVLMTDEAPAFKKLTPHYAAHFTTDHGANQYVKDGFKHTNTIEGAFSLFDRMVIGIYHSISPKHMQAYCNEHEFRYNNRKLSEQGKFEHVLSCVQTRITYSQLTSD
jgi:transposase-like protein